MVLIEHDVGTEPKVFDEDSFYWQKGISYVTKRDEAPNQHSLILRNEIFHF
jgi:hypothetical protein